MVNIYCIRPKGFNIGNDLIYFALSHFIRQAFRDDINIISIPATGKYEVHKKAGFNPETIYEINQSGGGLIIGGGNLYENGELEIHRTALKALSVPLMICGVSRGGIYDRNLRIVDRTDAMSDEDIILLNGASAISLSRDRATKEYLDGLNCDNEIMGCPTLFLNEIPSHLTPLGKGDVADCLISVRLPALMSIPASFKYRIQDEMRSMMSLLQDAGYVNIKILCHDHRDIPFAASFRGVPYLYTEDISTYLSYLSKVRLLVTYRLHSFIPCLSLGIPAINISYDQRSLSLVEACGMEEWNINMFESNVVDEVAARVSSLDEYSRMRSECEREDWKSLKEVITRNMALFAGLVEESQGGGRS